MRDGPPYLTHIPSRNITVTTAVAAGWAISSLHETTAPAIIAGLRPPEHLGSVRTRAGCIDPRAQHEQVVADVRAGHYGDLSDGAACTGAT